jgi:hypothetical protein
MADEQKFCAINAGESVLHVGRADDLLAHLGSEDLAEFEIYDSLGREMRIVESGGGERSLVPIDELEPGPSDKQWLVDRITCACARIQLRADRSTDAPPKGERVPVVQADLKVVLAALGASAFFELPLAGAGEEPEESRPTPQNVSPGPGPAVPDNRGSAYHNRVIHGYG